MSGKRSTFAGSARVVCKTLAVFFFSVGLATGSESSDGPTTLAAFSLSAARRALESGHDHEMEIDSLGFISRIWAVLLDDDDDLIIVGERDASVPSMSLDDAVVALRTMDSVGSGRSPGVSIEPPDPSRYSPTQNVVYYAGIDSTHYGQVCFEADLLLKQLGIGIALTGINGFPSEWDLLLDNARAGRRLNPWGSSAGRSWFFPLQVRMNHKDRCVTVTATTMEVCTDRDRELELPKKFLELDEEALARILDANPDAVSVILARLLTQRYDDIAKHHPVLVQLRNLLVLSGLMAELLDSSLVDKFDYWMNTYSVRRIANPTEVPTLSRGVNGVAYSCILSGGVLASFHAEDAWTDAILSRKPKYLRRAVLRSRPSQDAVSWVVPLGLGGPDEWTDELLQQVKGIEEERLSRLRQDAPDGYQTDVTAATRGSSPVFNIWPGSRTPLETPGWHPTTEGENLVAFRGTLCFSSGSYETFSSDGRFSLTKAEITAGMKISTEYVYKNRIGFEVTVPVLLKVESEDRPDPWLPGMSDLILAYVVGIDDPIIDNRIQLMSGISEGRWRLPTIVIKNSVVVPMYDGRIYEGTLSGGKYPFHISFGSTDWRGSHELQMAVPLAHNLRMYGTMKYQTDWKSPALGDHKVLHAGMNLLIQQESGSSIGLDFLTSSVKVQIVSGPERWLSEYSIILASFSFPAKNGYNYFRLGWLVPGEGSSSDVGGRFIVTIDLDGTCLWDRRLWF